MTADPDKATVLPCPRSLSRSEKANFRRIEALRNSIGKPISLTEVDALTDYVAARARLADMRNLYRRQFKELRAQGYDASARELVALARQLDAATASAQRLGRRLGLGSAG